MGIKPTQPSASASGDSVASADQNALEDAIFGYLDKIYSWVTLTDGANIATDASLGTRFEVTLAGNRTLDAPTSPEDGQGAIWRVIQDGTGSRTLTLATGSAGEFRYGTDITTITLSTDAGTVDLIGAVYHLGDDRWDVVAFMRGYS